MIRSIVETRGPVSFPQFMGERIYMHPFIKREGLPAEFARWQQTVDAMLDGVDVDGPIYLMVDQKAVKAGEAHRRPGVHVDGYWQPAISAHGGHGGTPPGHRGNSRHGGNTRHSGGASGWDAIDFSSPEAIILASDISACVAYEGEYDERQIRHGGDASLIHGDFNVVRMQAGRVYAGNVAMLHESIPVEHAVCRTVVRLNVPGWSVH